VVPPCEPRVQSSLLKKEWDTNDNTVKEEYILVVPNDRRETKYFSGDGVYTRIGITIWGTPVPGKSTPGGVVDYLKRPTKLSNHVGIWEASHIRVCPSVHGNIILVGLEGKVELLPVIDDIGSDEKVSRFLLVLSQERVEVVGWLYGKHAKRWSK
jgi:hypothetical protein